MSPNTGIFLHKNAQRLKFLCERNDKVFFSSLRSGAGAASQIYFMALRRSGLPAAATAPSLPTGPLEAPLGVYFNNLSNIYCIFTIKINKFDTALGNDALPGVFGLGAFAAAVGALPQRPEVADL